MLDTFNIIGILSAVEESHGAANFLPQTIQVRNGA